MADTVTNNYSLVQPQVGGDTGTWGGILNNGMIAAADAALGSVFAVTITSSDVALTASQFQNAIFVLTGALTGNHNLTIPLSPNSGSVACGGRFVVVNNTTGNFNVTVLTVAGGSVGVTVPQGFVAFLYSDGTNVGYCSTGLPGFAAAVNGNPNGQLAGTAGSVNTNASLAFDYTNKVLYICITTGTSSTAVWVTTQSLQPGQVTQADLAVGAAPLPPVFPQTADNLHLLNDATNPTRDINVTQGAVRDNANGTNMQLAATMYKRFDTSWAAGGASGSPQGVCDVGSKGTNQTWHVYIIGKLALAPTTYSRSGTTVTVNFGSAHGMGVGGTARVIGIGSGFDGIYAITATTTNSISYTSAVSGSVGTTNVPVGTIADGFDILASQSYPTPTYPAGWTVNQCLGSILTDGSANIRAFTQLADEFILSTSITTNQAAPIVSARTLVVVGVPTGLSVQARIRAIAVTNSQVGEAALLVTSPFESDQACTALFTDASGQGGSSVANNGATNVERWTNTSGQVGVRCALSGNSASLILYGWRDPRRRMF